MLEFAFFLQHARYVITKKNLQKLFFFKRNAYLCKNNILTSNYERDHKAVNYRPYHHNVDSDATVGKQVCLHYIMDSSG